MSHHTTEPPIRVRRFLPEPIETTTRSSKKNLSVSYVGTYEQENLDTAAGAKEGPNSCSSQNAPSTEAHIYIEPASSIVAQVHGHPPDRLQSKKYPVRYHIGRKHANLPLGLQRTNHLSGNQNETIFNADDSLQLRPRKFVPQLMETASRSFRRSPSPHTSYDKCQPELDYASLKDTSAAKDTPIHAGGHVARDSPFSYSKLRQRQEARRHSFRVPDLPVIPSSGSEGSEGSELASLPVSPSVSSRQSVIHPRVEEGRRESCDELLSSYLVSLAARSTEKQLREQALAAFPNEQVYQPVDHFAIDREEEDSPSQEELMIREGDEVFIKYRRASSADLSWELQYMRQHKEEAEMRDRAMVGTQGLHLSSTTSMHMVSGQGGNYLNLNRGQKRDRDRAQQRHARSPPMLGDDLIFPQSLSPETTFCESSNLAECNTDIPHFSGLWHATPYLDDHRGGGDGGGGGLWMGTCKLENHCQNFQDYLSCNTLTLPDYVKGNVWACSNGVLQFEGKPPITPRKKPEIFRETARNHSEANIDPEFQDGFVTQIYNYLSLGYPCVAHAKGYVCNAEITPTGAADKDVCMRWLALRSYIREWARQQPITAEDDGSHGTWGVRERRGSWAG
ncbi:hypothetical protein BDV28DRAFT_164267 [Aspergillus coremiiformis]|uniref:Uncharacterized protein n=1 Tax=Aspergillus coremiiformis TaxID=138285 RepID=A0A5N6YT18_9EURO|nr:hypothetical protein BDV28DRAFT_164267 [Aspergillus coremiiformis]